MDKFSEKGIIIVFQTMDLIYEYSAKEDGRPMIYYAPGACQLTIAMET